MAIPGFPPLGAPPSDMPPVDMPPPMDPGALPPEGLPEGLPEEAPMESGPGPGAQSILSEIMGKLSDLEARLSSLEGSGAGAAVVPPPPAGSPETSLPPELPAAPPL
jgi:hypothetical protein